MARQFEMISWDPEPCSHMILHYLYEENALQSEAYSKAHETARYRRLAAEPWFTPFSVTYHRRKKRFLKPG